MGEIEKEKDMKIVNIDLLLNEMNNEKTRYTCQIDIKQRANKNDVIDITLKAYRGLIFEIIKDLPTIKVPQWVSCIDGFPEEHKAEDGYIEPSEYVLIQDDCGNMFTSRYWGGKESGQKEKSIWIDLKYDRNIIAWMPLPQAYAGKELNQNHSQPTTI